MASGRRPPLSSVTVTVVVGLHAASAQATPPAGTGFAPGNPPAASVVTGSVMLDWIDSLVVKEMVAVWSICVVPTVAPHSGSDAGPPGFPDVVSQAERVSLSTAVSETANLACPLQSVVPNGAGTAHVAVDSGETVVVGVAPLMVTTRPVMGRPLLSRIVTVRVAAGP